MTASKSKKNKYEIDMCNGTVLDKLISFSIPLMLSSTLMSSPRQKNMEIFFNF